MPSKTLILIILSPLFLLVIGFLGYKYMVRQDFNVICDSYKWVLEQKDEDPTNLAFELAERIGNSIYTPAARTSFEALMSADQSMVYQLYLEAAKEAGYASWTCPEIEEYFSEVQDHSGEDLIDPVN